MARLRTIVAFWVLGTMMKMCLWRMYRSTDFEVHRNWLAITHSLPLKDWYFEDRNEWTLDYPPFFAYFEWVLSHFAACFDPKMLEVTAFNYASDATVLFQRLSVILTDTLLLVAVVMYCNGMKLKGRLNTSVRNTAENQEILVLALILVFLNPGLMLVDHVHFQYNGFLMGILLLSIAYIRDGNDLVGGILFAVVLNFKHIFLYVAPLYFVYLLRRYCMHVIVSSEDNSDVDSKENNSEVISKLSNEHVPRRCMFMDFIDVGNLIILGLMVVIVFALSFGPFVYVGGIDAVAQIFSRMFPFTGRGLCHAYWAPNIWAIYNIVDKVLEVYLRYIGSDVNAPSSSDSASMTGGFVEDIQHTVLWRITPAHTVALTLIAMSPILWQAWWRPDPRKFATYAGFCTMAAFMCGWHVHEKAILTVTMPLALGLLEIHGHSAKSLDPTQKAWLCPVVSRSYLLMCMAGHASLLPLIYTPFETPVKVFLLIGHILTCVALFMRSWQRKEARNFVPEDIVLGLYGVGLIVLQIFQSFVQPIFLPRLEFLPLLLWSLYTAIGLMTSSVIFWKFS